MAPRHLDTRPTPADCRADSRLERWEAAGKPFFVLAQRGRYRDICYDHGRLLARELEEGVFPEILATIAHDVDASRDLPAGRLDRILGAFFNRMSRDVLRSCSDEFRHGVEALEAGYYAGVPNPLFGGNAVEHACVAIDTGNIATGFDRIQAYRILSKRFGYWMNYATDAWAREDWGRTYADSAEAAPFEAVPLADWLAHARSGARRRAGMGCTGFWAAPAQTADGLGLHARNFDGAFFDWNNHPVLSLIDERPDNADYQRYAAVGTAGLIYPGGINGMNEAGIAVSLHQMSTVNFTTGDGDGAYDLAPFVQQRILRQARTLDEAVDIVRDRRHFASWTILVSHAPSGKALRIELNGRETTASAHARVFGDPYEDTVVASEPAERMVQTNHFLAEALRERHDFFRDAHFTKTVGKWMETRARMATAEARLADAAGADALDTPRALGILADHSDHAAGGAPRSFGRTICKAYSLVSSIMRASPDRSSPADEIWFTVGSADGTTPGPHTPLVGFGIDWAGRTVAPKGQHSGETVSAGRLKAMQAYVAAFRAYERPRGPDGALFRRKPTDGEMQKVRQVALAAMDEAVAAAEADGLADPAFRYIRARLRHETALAPGEPERARWLEAAAQDWTWLRDLAGDGGTAMTDWERALIFLLSAATEAAREPDDRNELDSFLETGREYLEKVAADSFGGGPVHQDIKSWRKRAAAIDADGPDADLPGIDFVTVE